MFGVEPETMDTGMELSSTVQAALPNLVAAVKALAET